MDKKLFKETDIAPCGINCGTCYVRLREKNPCCGCWSDNSNKPNHCITCSIKNCEHLDGTDLKLCYECELFPCRRLKQFDYRYRKNYRFSLISNLRSIQELGMDAFLKIENEKWVCPYCNRVVSIHKPDCLICGHPIDIKDKGFVV